MGLTLETVEYFDHGGGADLASSPTKTPDNKASYSLNMDYNVDGALRSRYGSFQLNLFSQIPGGPRGLGLFDFIKSDGSEYEVSAFGTDLYLGYENPVAQGFTLDAGLPFPCFEYFNGINDDYMYYGNGVDANLEFDGTVWRSWSIAQAPAVSLNALNAGNLPPGDYTYVVAFANYDAGTGVTVKIGPVSPEFTVTVPAGPNQEIVLNIPVAPAPAAPLTQQVNARILYRLSPTSSGDFFQLIDLAGAPVVITDNVTATYTDNNPTDGTIEPDFDLQVVGPTPIFCEYGTRMFYVEQSAMADLRWSEPAQAWNARATNLALLDGKITAMHRFFGTLIITTERSIWVQSGDPNDPASSLRRISSKIGALNNRCIRGEDVLYFMATSRKVYQLRPTDLNQDEIRIDAPLSTDIYPLLQTISIARADWTCMEYFTAPDTAKLVTSYNLGAGNNQHAIVFNEQQSEREEETVWQPWDHMEIAAIKQVQTQNQNRLIYLDFNGFIWAAEQQNLNADGAEINGIATGGTNNTISDTDRIEPEATGTATAGGALTLTDNTKVWTIDEWATDQIYIFAGTGAGQTRLVQSNTADTITVTVAWGVVPDATSQYYIGGFIVNGLVGQKITLLDGTGADQVRTVLSNTPVTITVTQNWDENPDNTTEFTVGGYDSFHFSNWKYVLESYDMLKQLWYLWINANANGDYFISLILQIDFDTSLNNQTELLVNLSALNSIWGQFIWGLGVWGSRSVFFDRFRVFSRFRAIRVGFRNRKAGQPFQINTFGISAQNKKLFFKKAA